MARARRGGPPLLLAAAAAVWLVATNATAREPQDLQQVLAHVRTINRTVMEAGELAADRGSEDDVRDLGERLWRDHAFTARRVHRFADERDLEVGPYRPSATHLKLQLRMIRERMERLRRLRGQEFDDAFVDLMWRMHADAVRQFHALAVHTRSAPLRRLLGDILPVLQQHLRLAKALQPDRVTAKE